MSISATRVEKCLAAIRSVCGSPRLDQYLVGFTGSSASVRGDQYRTRAGFEHLVVLADRLTQADALELEGRLQEAIWSDPSGEAWRKYHEEKKANGRIYPSSGGVQCDPSVTECSVYMAWWDKSDG